MNKNFTSLYRYAAVLLIACTFSLKASATDTTGLFSVRFTSIPSLLNGLLNTLGSKYLFLNVAPGKSATVTIVSATGGATVDMLDDNNLTKPEAFSPRITVPAGSTGTVEFKIEFTSILGALLPMDSLYATAMDIDGNSTLKEIDVINMGGGVVSYQSSAPEISVTNSGTQYTAKNIAGIEYPEVDTSAKAVMFTVANKNVQSFIYKAGAQNGGNGSVTRQKGIYFKGFVYPTFSVLPVTISSFSASNRGDNNLVKWETSSESNTARFIVEKSTDGRTYSAIGEVTAAGNSSQARQYQFTDGNIGTGTCYYRLRTIDRDGQSNYSAAVMVKRDADTHQISLFPCPAVDFTIVSISAGESETVTLRMLDANGKTVFSRQENITRGTTNIRLGQLDRYHSGSYYLQVVQKEKTTTKPFMIL